MSVKVRPASSADIPVLVELMAEFYAESSFSLDRAWAARSFSALLNHPQRGAAWIASLDERPAGHVVLCLRHSMDSGGLDGHVDDLFVRPEARRHGVARGLFGALVNHARSHGVLVLHVEAAPENAAAQAFYAALGFRAQTDRQLVAKRL